MAFDRFFGFDLIQRQTLVKLLAALGVTLDDIESGAADLQAQIDNLNAWATALATKLNTDAGVTDTNYDTNPQA